ncbi:MAG TPA: hypothetical protein VHM02_03855 [Thermoanaerobaculia bacterium]|nr:hypothetical protein [Thermoanaerobaculia bacterium]
MSWFVARLRDDVDPGLQTGALVHRFEWLSVALAASGEDAAALALFAAAGPGGTAAAPEVYLTPGCEPFLRLLLEGLEPRACEPPAPERLVRLGGGAGWRDGFLARRQPA